MDFDRRAATGFAADVDMAAALRDEVPDHGEVVKSRIEIAAVLAACRHRDRDGAGGSRLAARAAALFACGRRCGLEAELAAFRHGVACHDREIENRGHQLVGIDKGKPGGASRHCVDLDLLAQRRAKQAGRIDQQGIDVDVARLRWLAAREREQVRRQIGATGGGVGDQSGDRGKVRPVCNGLGQDFRSFR